MTELPLIDISSLGGQDCIAKTKSMSELGDAFHQFGFAVIIGHGISANTVKSLRSAAADYFALPFSEKSKLMVQKNNYRGYIPLGFFTPNADRNKVDQYQGFKLHTEVNENDPICNDCDLYGPNRWPLQTPHLQAAVMNYWHDCDRVSLNMLEALALYLGLDGKAFSKKFKLPLTNMTLLHYPACKRGATASGIHPHRDTDALTLLAPDPVGGLYIRPTQSSKWIEAKAPENALIANVGDMLEIWSGGHFISTPHKVENHSNQERLSFPYFAVPRFDTVVKPLCSPQKPEFQRSIHVGEVSAKIWRSNWPDAAPIEQCYDPYTT